LLNEGDAKDIYLLDAATPISKFKDLVNEKGWKDKVTVGLIGSCTNSSYQDMYVAIYP
jgi:aconitase A